MDKDGCDALNVASPGAFLLLVSVWGMFVLRVYKTAAFQEQR
jgi:hypothetical protein